jgi:hypothetical protein
MLIIWKEVHFGNQAIWRCKDTIATQNISMVVFYEKE